MASAAALNLSDPTTLDIAGTASRLQAQSSALLKDQQPLKQMFSGLGSLKCNGSSLVGTFDVEGTPRYIAVDVRPSTQSFECKSATLTYSKVAQLDGYFSGRARPARTISR